MAIERPRRTWRERRRRARPRWRRAAADRRARPLGGQPQHRRGVGRAAAQARGDRDALVDRHPQARRPPARSRNARSAAPARFGPSTPGQTTSSRPGAARRHLVAQVERLHERHELVTAVLARRAEEQAEVDLRRARARSARPSASAARGTPPARGARRGRRPGGRAAASAARARSRTPAPPRARAPASAAAPCGGGRTRADDARAASGAGAAAGALQHDEHAVDVGHREEDRARHRAQHAHVAGELREHRRHAVGGAAGRRRRTARRPPSGPSRPTRHAGAAPRSCAGSRRRRCRRAGWRRPSSAPARARARSSAHRVGEVQRRVGERRERVAQRRLQRAVELDDVDVRERAARCSVSTPSPPPISSTTSSGPSSRGALDHAEDVRVDEEVLAELAVGPHAELAQAAQARLARGARFTIRRAAAALGSTSASSSS